MVGGCLLHWRVGREQVGRDPLDPLTGREQVGSDPVDTVMDREQKKSPGREHV